MGLRIMVMGSKGMLGRQVVRAAIAAGHEAYTPPLDITILSECIACVVGARPDWVINCAGIVPDRDASWERMAAVNGVGPRFLAEACRMTGARLLQVSTDCVFRGSFNRAATIINPASATDPYGLSKRLGEVGDLIVRCSFVGRGERGTLAWLQRVAANGQEVRRVDGWLNTAWNGGTAPAVARVLVQMVEDDRRGVVHLAGTEIITKAELLRRLIHAFDLPMTVRDVYEPNPPKYRALDPTILLPDLDESIAELARDAE